MAGVTPWLLAALLLLPALAAPLFGAMRGDCNNRLVAVQMGTTLTALCLASLSFAFDQPSFIDLALCSVFLAVPGTYVFTVFMERWL